MSCRIRHSSIDRRQLSALVRALGVCLLTFPFGLLSSCSNTPPVANAELAATQFLDQLRHGRVDEAWTSTTAEFKSAEGREAFRRSIRNEKVLKTALKQSSSETVNVNELERLKLTYRPADGSSSKTVEILLAVDDAAWKVESFLVK
jgi:hypothetical protein